MKHPLKEGTRVHHRAQEWNRHFSEEQRRENPQWGWGTVVGVRGGPYSDGSYEYDIRKDAPLFEGGSTESQWASYHIDEWDFHWVAPAGTNASRPYRFIEYPGGCRCSCCDRIFEELEPMFDRVVGDIDGSEVATPVCASCNATNAPLTPRHPYADGGGSVVFAADGRVDRRPNRIDVG